MKRRTTGLENELLCMRFKSTIRALARSIPFMPEFNDGKNTVCVHGPNFRRNGKQNHPLIPCDCMYHTYSVCWTAVVLVQQSIVTASGNRAAGRDPLANIFYFADGGGATFLLFIPLDETGERGQPHRATSSSVLHRGIDVVALKNACNVSMQRSKSQSPGN